MNQSYGKTPRLIVIYSKNMSVAYTNNVSSSVISSIRNSTLTYLKYYGNMTVRDNYSETHFSPGNSSVTDYSYATLYSNSTGYLQCKLIGMNTTYTCNRSVYATPQAFAGTALADFPYHLFKISPNDRGLNVTIAGLLDQRSYSGQPCTFIRGHGVNTTFTFLNISFTSCISNEYGIPLNITETRVQREQHRDRRMDREVAWI